jgi:hypothetical protein
LQSAVFLSILRRCSGTDAGKKTGAIMEEQDEGFSSIFYIMLILGIIGVIGFLFVAAGAAGGTL